MNINYEGTSESGDDRLVGSYDFSFDSLGADGAEHPDTMPVTIWLVTGEDDDDNIWWSWREDCDGGSSDMGGDYRTRVEAQADAERHLREMSRATLQSDT